jgi:hypothetical protein
MQTWVDTPRLPVAWGEVFDKLTILAIKHEKISDPSKRANVANEFDAISAIVGDFGQYPDELTGLYDELKAINLRLWDVEDGKRACERTQSFGEDFVALAREVYFGNDKRAALKRQINDLLGSALVEEKSYKAY